MTTIEFPTRTDNRDELILRINFEGGRFQALLDRVSDDLKVAPLAEGEWSIKDHLTHITTWAGKALAAIEDRPAHVGLGLASAPADPHDYNALNSVLHARNASVSLLDAEKAWRSIQDRTVAALRRIKDGDLYRPWGIDDLDGATVGDVVSADTYEHFLEHGLAIRELLFRHHRIDIPG